MRAIQSVALLIAAMAVAGCGTEIAAQPNSIKPAVVAAPAARPANDRDVMRAALSQYDLQTGRLNDQHREEVSVIRDIAFEVDGLFLTSADVARLVILQNYLRAHPAVAVRVEAQGDGPKRTQSNASLSLERAESVKRALQTDTNVKNTIVATGLARAASASQSRQAEIILVMPRAVGDDVRAN